MKASIETSLRERVMSETCFRHGAHPSREDTSRTTALWTSKSRGVRGASRRVEDTPSA
jgi:hypothetical protein